tara:strand:+ start:434 stop:769 length:336 start_codon:yes stop_codon:yes gene_type:complete
MYDTIDFNAFNNWFIKHRPDNFSYEGRKALFEYLDELDGAVTDETGSNSCLGIKFDPIAICCEYSEYENLEEFNKDYSFSDKFPYKDIEQIEEITSVIKIPDSQKFIIQVF